MQFDINTATEEQITVVPGIGKELARRIAMARPFKTLMEVQQRVQGIGPKKYITLTQYAYVSQQGEVNFNRPDVNVDAPVKAVPLVISPKVPVIMDKLSRKISEPVKKLVAGRQFYKCANKPGEKVKGLGNFKCPMWAKADENKGSFDQSGFEIDHIMEFSIGGSNEDVNLQALCHSCHALKTKRFMMNIADDELLSDVISACPAVLASQKPTVQLQNEFLRSAEPARLAEPIAQEIHLLESKSEEEKKEEVVVVKVEEMKQEEEEYEYELVQLPNPLEPTLPEVHSNRSTSIKLNRWMVGLGVLAAGACLL